MKLITAPVRKGDIINTGESFTVGAEMSNDGMIIMVIVK